MKHIACCSFGKDSLATIILAYLHGEPLDEIVYARVMFDKNRSAEVPEHEEFINKVAVPALQYLGYKVTIVESETTATDCFFRVRCKGADKGKPVAGRYRADAMYKEIANSKRYGGTTKALAMRRLYNTSVLPWMSQNGWQEWAKTKFLCWPSTELRRLVQLLFANFLGYTAPFMSFQTVAVAFSAPTQSSRSCGTLKNTTPICGASCWNAPQHQI